MQPRRARIRRNSRDRSLHAAARSRARSLIAAGSAAPRSRIIRFMNAASAVAAIAADLILRQAPHPPLPKPLPCTPVRTRPSALPVSSAGPPSSSRASRHCTRCTPRTRAHGTSPWARHPVQLEENHLPKWRLPTFTHAPPSYVCRALESEPRVVAVAAASAAATAVARGAAAAAAARAAVARRRALVALEVVLQRAVQEVRERRGGGGGGRGRGGGGGQ